MGISATGGTGGSSREQLAIHKGLGSSRVSACRVCVLPVTFMSRCGALQVMFQGFLEFPGRTSGVGVGGQQRERLEEQEV